MNRTILHCDLNAFFASVECLYSPELNNVPMAVAGNPDNRHGIILAKNELAKSYKVKTAETIWQAKKKCPTLILVPPRYNEYSKYSRMVNDIYEEFTDRVEPFGIDESWLDVTSVTGLFGDGVSIAQKIRESIKSRIGLTVSVGVSFNKVFAKLGSDYKKPDATTLISPHNYKEIVYPLPVTDLLYVGKKSALTLERYGIKTIGELAQFSKAILSQKLGKQGEVIWNFANGIDDTPVSYAGFQEEVKSIGNGWTFKRNLQGLDDIRAGVNALSEEVAYRLRKKNLKCTTVSVGIKDPDFKSFTRQRGIAPTNLSSEISALALTLILENWAISNPIRLLSVVAMNLVNKDYKVEQLSFFDKPQDITNKVKSEKLETTLDLLREKYGKNKVSIGGAGTKLDLGISSFEIDKKED